MLMRNKLSFYLILFLLCALFLSGGCGGGGSGGGDDEEPDLPEEAAPIFVIEDEHVLLENPVYQENLFTINPNAIVSISFKENDDSKIGLAPKILVLSEGEFGVGDVLLSGPSGHSTFGFGAVVEKAERNSNNTYTYTLRQASIGDLLISGKLFASLNDTPSSFITTPDQEDIIFSVNRIKGEGQSGSIFDGLWDALANERFNTDLEPILEHELPRISYAIGGNLELGRKMLSIGISGSYSVDIRSGFSLMFEWDRGPRRVGLAVPYIKETSLNLNIQAQANEKVLDEEFGPRVTIARKIILIPTPFWVPFPLVVGLCAQGKVEASLSLGADLDLSTSTATIGGAYGFTWQDTEGTAFLKIEPRPNKVYPVNSSTSTDAQVEFEVEVGIGPDLAFAFYDWLDFFTIENRVGFTRNRSYNLFTNKYCDNLDIFAKISGVVNLLKAFADYMDDKWKIDYSFDFLTLSMNIFNNCIAYINGIVSNAINDQPINNAKIVIRLLEDGEVLEEVFTDEAGSFSLESIESGNYFVEVSADGFVTLKQSIEIDKSTTESLKFSLSPEDANVARVVLRWGSTPRDIDSHLTGPLSTGTGRFHVYWNSKRPSGADAWLDWDDVSSYGPETITIERLIPGTYRYSVHDYSNRSRMDSSALSYSGASVSVFFDNGEKRTYYVPAGKGNLWTVFELVVQSNGRTTIHPIQSMSNVDGSTGVLSKSKQKSE